MESDSTYSADELGQYRSLSSSAVLSLVLGLLSPAVFFSLLLLVVPLTAAALALWSLVHIKKSAGTLLGSRLAYCGLALAVLFGVSAVSKQRVQIELLRRQAEATAQLWLSYVSHGQSDAALELLAPAAKKKLSSPAESVATAPIFESELANAQLEQDPFTVKWASLEPNEQSSLMNNLTTKVFLLQEPRALVAFQTASSQEIESTFQVSLLKRHQEYGPSTWLVDGWKVAEREP